MEEASTGIYKIAALFNSFPVHADCIGRAFPGSLADHRDGSLRRRGGLEAESLGLASLLRKLFSDFKTLSSDLKNLSLVSALDY